MWSPPRIKRLESRIALALGTIGAPQTPWHSDEDAAGHALGNVKTLSFVRVDNGNSGGAFSVDWRSGTKQTLTLTAACVVAFVAPLGDATNLLLKLTQGGAGGHTITWPASVRWAGGGTAPTLSPAAGAVDIVTFFYDGSLFYGTYALNFA